MGDQVEGRDMDIRNSDEARLLLNIFPEELWCLILGNVKKMPEYLKVINAAPLFRLLLRPRATQILFPEVFQIAAAQDRGEMKWIAARKICSAWKKGLDDVHQEQLYFNLPDDERLPEMEIGIPSEILTKPYLLLTFLEFGSVENFLKFEKHFDATHLAAKMNPFVTRKVCVWIEDVALERFYAACLQFLEKYGTHIWYFIMKLNEDEAEVVLDFYNRRLEPMLSRMPNLQALDISSGALAGRLENRLARVSLPALPHLEYVSARGLPLLVLEQIFHTSSQVQYVYNGAAEGDRLTLCLEKLSNLREMAFTLNNGDQALALSNAEFKSGVQRLWLDMADLEHVSTTQMFRTIERKFASLVELHLGLSKWWGDLKGSSRLVMPCLKILHLEMRSPQRLEFLLSLKDTLEKLYLALYYHQRHTLENRSFEFETERRSQILVYTVWNEPQNSNIWVFLPKLQVFGTKLFKRKVLEATHLCARKDWKKTEMLPAAMEQ